MNMKITRGRVLFTAAAGPAVFLVPMLVNAQRQMDTQTLPGLAQEVQRKHAQSGEILDRESVMKGDRELQILITLGDQLWHSRDLPMSGNGQAGNMCHADGSDTHPETYTKFQP